MRFKDKVVLVTGASRGIGQAIALAFGKEGASVMINHVHQPDEAKAVQMDIEKLGGKAMSYHADVTSYEETQALVEATIKAFGRIDILVNNAGITKDQLMLRMSEADFDAVIAVNLKGTWNMIKHASRSMLKQRYGRIINIASVVGIIGNPGQVNYVASKAGVIGITKSLSKEFGKKNVTVNAIAPGFIETKMTEALTDDIKNAYLTQIPLGRLGQPEDIAEAAMFLASDAANYITGHTLNVNGGMIG